MSFPRAPLTRFNDKPFSIAPAPNTYTPRLPPSASAKVLRFGNINEGNTTRPATPTLSSENFYLAKSRMFVQNLQKQIREEMAPMADKLKAVRNSLYQCQQESNLQIQLLEDERQALLEKIKELQEENTELNARVATLEETIAGLKEELKMAEVVCNQEIDRLKEPTGEHSGMNQQEMRATIAGLTDTVHNLAAENEMLKRKKHHHHPDVITGELVLNFSKF